MGPQCLLLVFTVPGAAQALLEVAGDPLLPRTGFRKLLSQLRVIEAGLRGPSSSPGHASVSKSYWERYRIPTDDGAGREMTQAYALVTIPRREADEIVAQLLGDSPTQIAVAGLAREAAFLVAEAKKVTREGLVAGRENRVPEVMRAQERGGELIHDLERVKKRHDLIADEVLQVDVVGAKSGVAMLDKHLISLLVDLKLSVKVDVYTGVQQRIQGLERLLAGILNSFSLPTTPSGGAPCAQGQTHWLHATFNPPNCVRPETGHVCDLSLELSLGRCPSLEAVDSHTVDPAALRGRGSSDRRAVLQAWASIEGPNLAALTREVRVLLAAHLPTAKRVREAP